jgi:hypothetical protein
VLRRGPGTGPRPRLLREAAPDGAYGVWLTTRETARRRGVSPSVVWRAVTRGELAPVRFRGRRGYRFEVGSVEAWRPPCDRPRSPAQADEALLTILQLAAQRLGRQPTQRDLVCLAGMPSVTTFRRRFGSYRAALRGAGLAPARPTPHGRRRPRTHGELLALLRALAASLGRAPTCTDVLRTAGMPPPSTFVRRFGSWRRALRVALADASGEWATAQTDATGAGD